MPKDKKGGAETEDVYEMEDIIDFKREHNTDFYLIKWQGYGVEDATWEPRKNIMDPDSLQKKKMHDLKTKWLEHVEAAVEESSSVGKKRRKTAESKSSGLVAEREMDDGDVNKKQNSHKEMKEVKSALYKISQEDCEKENSNNTVSNQIEEQKVKDVCSVSENVNEERKAHNLNLKNSETADKSAGKDSSKAPTFVKLPRVVHIREREGALQVLMETNDSTKESEDARVWLDMSVAREIYSQELLDYLLARLRFKRHSA